MGVESSQEIGQSITSEVIEFSIYPDTEIAQRLKISTTERVYRTKRVRKINDRPQIISFMPVALFPELTIRVLEHSKLTIRRKTGHAD